MRNVILNYKSCYLEMCNRYQNVSEVVMLSR